MNPGVVNANFWMGKKVFITGHTGFKGGWLTIWLSSMGALVYGYALKPKSSPNIYDFAGIADLCVCSHIGDIADSTCLQESLDQASPDIVMHLAAQPLVRYSYLNPVETYRTNVMGTVNLLEAVRKSSTVRAVLVVTSDKCYENQERIGGYREYEAMGGYDPYSSSKGCAELVVAAYRQSYFSERDFDQHRIAIASCRAGNVIGGGDWSEDRLIPDAIKAFEVNQALKIRNPTAIRPWQHVLEPLSGYLVLAQALYEKGCKFNGGWNFGPNDDDARSVKEVAELLIAQFGGSASWIQDGAPQPHEAHFLKLDCSKAALQLGWRPKWSLEKAIQAIAEWHEGFAVRGNVLELTKSQIIAYQGEI